MGVSVEKHKFQDFVGSSLYDVVIVGSGPYGLSAAAHLRGRGLKVAVFGKPLNFWLEHMPEGMLLRSYWWATSLSHPGRKYNLEHYFKEHGLQGHDPLPAETFIDYALWFQRQAVPNVDETYVEHISRENGYYRVALEDGRLVQCRAVVMAPGLRYYAYKPAEFAHLSSELVSHSSDHHTLRSFAGRQVVVLGGGQGALETAALLHESGAGVEVVSRSKVHWIVDSATTHRTLLQRIRRPQAGTAQGWYEWSLENIPYGFQLLPQSTKDHLCEVSFGPMGAHWLRDRVVGKIPLHELQQVQATRADGDHVEITLSNSKKLIADHLMLGTGYRVDVKKLPMLDTSLVTQIKTYHNAPVLNGRFESSVPGLYFIGISSMTSCGPLYRFVVGTEATASRLARSVEQRAVHAR